MVQGSCRLPCFAALRGGVKSPTRTAWGGRHTVRAGVVSNCERVPV